jgi:hypothetical protein
MEILQIFKPYINEIILSISGVIAYLFGRNKRLLEEQKDESDIKHSELDNVQGALGIYRIMLDDLKLKLDAVNLAYNELERKLEFEMIKAKQYEMKIERLDKENRELMKTINTCEFECKFKKNGTE